MSNAQARADHFNSVMRRCERRSRNHLTTLREMLDKADRRVNSTDALDRGLLSSSATEMARVAAELAEEASAWQALSEVAYMAEVPAEAELTAPGGKPADARENAR